LARAAARLAAAAANAHGLGLVQKVAVDDRRFLAAEATREIGALHIRLGGKGIDKLLNSFRAQLTRRFARLGS